MTLKVIRKEVTKTGEHAWLVGKIAPRMVMQGVGSEFWSDTLARYNNKYRAWANFPEDPGLN